LLRGFLADLASSANDLSSSNPDLVKTLTAAYAN
jgi:hypothetical protein